ncbi:hypothetical protein VYU27_003845 [Nannochloropsis oceanica]
MGDIPPNQTLYVQNLPDKLKKEALKKQLYMAFSAYGRVIDVVACKGNNLRGQAWVVYDSVGSATTALRSLQGFQFFGRPLRIFFATGKSDAVALRQGQYEPKAKRQKREKAEREGGKGKETEGPRGGGGEKVKGNPVASGEVSSMLMAQDLPAEINDEMLGVLFARFDGFQEIRLAGQRGIAFIEFRDELAASTALSGLNEYKLSPTHTLKLSYAKR